MREYIRIYEEERFKEIEIEIDKEDLEKLFPWLNKCKFKNAIIKKNGNWLYWIDGDWIDGTFKGKVWYNGTWHKGIFEGTEWLDGTWKGGYFAGEYWLNGIFETGDWHSGNFINGTWKNGAFLDGDFRNGVWENGIFQHGTFHNGTWKKGVWKGGEWKGGTWIEGLIDGKKSNIPPRNKPDAKNLINLPKEIRQIRDPNLYNIAVKLITEFN
jgi:hypothetical protein